MKILRTLMLFSVVVLVSACSSSDDDDDNGDSVTFPIFSEFTRNVFATSANSEPVSVTEGVDFSFSESDVSDDFSDLIN